MQTSKRRLRRIFGRDGRTLIVAMDHIGGGFGGPRLDDPRPTIQAVVRGGADAVMTTFGVARRHLDDIDDRGLILSLDSQAPTDEYGVELALDLGADAVKVLGFTSSPTLPQSITWLRRLGARCARSNMPLIAEMIPVSFQDAEHHTPEKIGLAARQGGDCGADAVKVHFTGDVASFAPVVRQAGVPVVILGGARSGNDRDVLTSLRAALDAGAVGGAIGRNIWAHPEPERMTAALAKLIHEDASVDRAAAELERKAVAV